MSSSNIDEKTNGTKNREILDINDLTVEDINRIQNPNLRRVLSNIRETKLANPLLYCEVIVSGPDFPC